jgi:diguanylate cyclase (GGDEF)-like protein
MPLHLETLKGSFNETKEELSKQINKYKIILKDYINEIVSEFNSIYDKIKNLQKNQPRENNSENRKNKIEKLIKRDLKIFELIEKEEFFKFIPKNSRIEIYDIHNFLEKLLVGIKGKEKEQAKTNNKAEKLQSNLHEGEKEITREEKSFEFGSTRRIYEIAKMLKGAISSKAPEEAENLYKDLSNEIKNFLIKCIIQGHRKEVERLKVDPITHFKTRNCLQILINRKKINNINIKGLAIVDLDNLKQINDRYGHLIGDKVIQKVSKIISKVVSQNTNAEIIRYGGDEFLILFFDDKNFVPTLHRIIDEIGKTKIIVKKEKIKLTASIGATKKVRDLDRSIKIADKNLYEAKKQGGNKVIIS